MNLGDNRWHRKYICDKCKQPIPYIAHKGIPVNKYYKAVPKAGVNEKSFDLCNKCEKEFRKWLNTKETKTIRDLFLIYEEN